MVDFGKKTCVNYRVLAREKQLHQKYVNFQNQIVCEIVWNGLVSFKTSVGNKLIVYTVV